MNNGAWGSLYPGWFIMIESDYQRPINSNPTANLSTGLTCLWRIARKMCMQSLAWKLLQDLEDNRIGTNEVESLAAKREWQREVKKGIGRSFREYSKRGDKRDQDYVCGLLRLRAVQAKTDWAEERRRYRKKKGELSSLAEESGKENMFKKELVKIAEEHKEVYRIGR